MTRVDKKVHIPPARIVAQPVYPWEKMEVGDSFFVNVGPKNNFSGAISKAQKRYGYKITRRSVVERGVRGIRVWRIE